MEWSLSGSALKTLARSVTCLARIGNELVIQASPSQVVSWEPNREIYFTSTSSSYSYFLMLLFNRTIGCFSTRKQLNLSDSVDRICLLAFLFDLW